MPPRAVDYLPMARRMAWRANRMYNTPFDDAFSDAQLGVVEAVGKCNNEQTAPAYIAKTCWYRILRGIRQRAYVRKDSVYYKEYGTQPTMVSYDFRLHDPEETANPLQSVENGALWDVVDDTLSARDSYVVRSYYQRGMSQSVIARIVGVSQMQISRILKKSCDMLAKVV